MGSAVDDWTLWDQFPKVQGLTGAKLIPKKHGLKLMCMQIANNDIIQFDILYRRTRYSEVRLLQGLQAAASYKGDQSGGSEGNDTD